MECPEHKGQVLNWVCVEKVCAGRLLCQVCIIQGHIKKHQNYVPLEAIVSNPMMSLKFPEMALQKKQASAFSEESILQKIQLEEDKLNEIFTEIVVALRKKLAEVKQQFEHDLQEF